MVGVSWYDKLEPAITAARDAADQVALRKSFTSPTGPHGNSTRERRWTNAHERLGIPVGGIGVVTGRNGSAPVEAGADSLAAVDPDVADGDIETATSGHAAVIP